MMKAFPKTIEIVWCQEEPEIWADGVSLSRVCRKLFEREIAYAVAMPARAPAVGSLVHTSENKPVSSPTPSRLNALQRRSPRRTPVYYSAFETKWRYNFVQDDRTPSASTFDSTAGFFCAS